jgi:hypothetical protein
VNAPTNPHAPAGPLSAEERQLADVAVAVLRNSDRAAAARLVVRLLAAHDAAAAERDAAAQRAEAAAADCDAMIRAVNRFDEAAADVMTRAGLTIINQPGATTRQAIEVLGHMIAERNELKSSLDSLRAQLQAEAAARAGVEAERDALLPLMVVRCPETNLWLAETFAESAGFETREEAIAWVRKAAGLAAGEEVKHG